LFRYPINSDARQTFNSKLKTETESALLQHLQDCEIVAVDQLWFG